MDRALLTTIAVTALAAGLVSAGASYVAVSTLVPAAAPAPGPAPAGPRGNATAPGNSSAPDPAAPESPRPVWTFVVRGELPEAGGRGTVVVFLSKVQGDVNRSATNGSIPVEAAAVGWDARNLAPQGNGTILETLNAQFTRAPPVALARAALSRHQDAMELTVPGDRNVTTIVVNAPATGGFLMVHWPTGTAYGWDEERRTWAGAQEPALLARPVAQG